LGAQAEGGGASKVAVAGIARERDGVADILKPGANHDQTLESKTKTGVGNSAEAPEVEVPGYNVTKKQ
jgi:hypothetical protein